MNPVVKNLDPQVLQRVLSRAEQAGKRGVVVFDLDSTLLDNRPRQARILREFGAQHGVAALAATQPEHWQGWEIRRAMANAGLAQDEIDRWADAAKAFWRERFFTSEYCVDDWAVQGAVDYVREVLARAQVAYCTGRHEEMRAGTVESFRRLGFPVPGHGVTLLVKPTFDMHDDAFKQLAYARLRGLGDVIAAFDNEPTHINGYREAFPDADVVHVATDHSGREVVLLDGIPSVSDFRHQ